VHTFKNYYGPTINAFEAAEKNGKAANLQQEVEESFISQNKITMGDYHSDRRYFYKSYCCKMKGYHT